MADPTLDDASHPLHNFTVSGLIPWIRQRNPKAKIVYRSHIEICADLIRDDPQGPQAQVGVAVCVYVYGDYDTLLFVSEMKRLMYRPPPALHTYTRRGTSSGRPSSRRTCSSRTPWPTSSQTTCPWRTWYVVSVPLFVFHVLLE